MNAQAPGVDFDIAGVAGGTGERVRLTSFALVVAGYTGRDAAAVQAHIDELAEIGVAPPARVPMFYEFPTTLLTQEGEVAVSGDQTSGEVEPVLVRASGRTYVAVGSDHTDRALERDDVARSKAACPKPVSRQVIAADAGFGDWDAVALTSKADGTNYQAGTIAMLRPPLSLLSMWDEENPERAGTDIVMYCGTVPLAGSFQYAGDWSATLRPTGGPTIECAYRVTTTKEGTTHG